MLGFDIIRKSKSPEQTFLGTNKFPIRTIIDVGANRGQFAKTAHKIFPEARIYCFEPVKSEYEELSKWIINRNKTNIKAYNIALGDSEGIKGFFIHKNHTPSSSLLKTTKLCHEYYKFTEEQISTKVNVTTLDAWRKSIDLPIDPEIFIKLDVQGYELNVIKGGLNVFTVAKAVLIEVNFDKLYENQPSFTEIHDEMKNIGFTYSGNVQQSYANNGHMIFADILFVKQ